MRGLQKDTITQQGNLLAEQKRRNKYQNTYKEYNDLVQKSMAIKAQLDAETIEVRDEVMRLIGWESKAPAGNPVFDITTSASRITGNEISKKALFIWSSKNVTTKGPFFFNRYYYNKGNDYVKAKLRVFADDVATIRLLHDKTTVQEVGIVRGLGQTYDIMLAPKNNMLSIEIINTNGNADGLLVSMIIEETGEEIISDTTWTWSEVRPTLDILLYSLMLAFKEIIDENPDDNSEAVMWMKRGLQDSIVANT